MTPPRVRYDPDGTPYVQSRRRPRANGTTPGETYRNQLRRLGSYLMKHYGDQISDGGAVDNAIRILEEHRMGIVERLATLSR